MRYFLMLALCVSVLPSLGQVIQFDSTGRLIGAPAPHVVPKNFVVEVVAPKADIKKLLIEKLKKARAYLKDPANILALRQTGFVKEEINELTRDLDTAISGKEKDFDSKYFPWNYVTTDTGMVEFVPYSLELWTQHRKTGLLTADSTAISLSYHGDRYKSSSVTLDSISMATYKVTRQSVMPKIIKAWYKKTEGKAMLDSIQLWNFYLARMAANLRQIKEQKSVLQDSLNKIDAFKGTTRAKNSKCENAQRIANSIVSRINSVNDTIVLAQSIRKHFFTFLLRWMWLNENMAHLNAFEKVTHAGQIGKLNADLEKHNKQLIELTIKSNALERRIALLENAIQKERPLTFNQIKELEDTVYYLTVQKGNAERSMAEALENANKAKKAVADLKPTDLGVLSQAIYEGKAIYSESDKKVNYVRHHDFNNGFQLMRQDEDLYPDWYRINVLVHNVPVADTLTFAVITRAFEEQSLLFQDLGPALEALGTIDYTVFPGLKSGQEKFTIETVDSATNKGLSVRIKTCTELRHSVDKINKSNKTLQENLTDLTTKKLFAPMLPEFMRKKVPTYRSELKPLDSLNASRVVTYTLGSKKQDGTFKSEFKLGKSFRFLPAAGFVYSFVDYPRLEVKDNTINSTGEYGGVIGTVGIKTYFLQKSFLSNRKTIFESRDEVLKGMFFVYTGIGLPEPKNNYLMGAGADIVTGLSLNAGIHVIRISQPDFINGGFIGSNHFYRTSLYFGLTADPAVITDIIKLF